MRCLWGVWKRHCNLFGGSTVPSHTSKCLSSPLKTSKNQEEIIRWKKCGLLASGSFLPKNLGNAPTIASETIRLSSCLTRDLEGLQILPVQSILSAANLQSLDAPVFLQGTLCPSPGLPSGVSAAPQTISFSPGGPIRWSQMQRCQSVAVNQ